MRCVLAFFYLFLLNLKTDIEVTISNMRNTENEFGSSQLEDHVRQDMAETSMQRYLHEKDRYKEFLLGYRGGEVKRSEVVGHNLKKWKDIWESVTQPAKPMIHTKRSGKSTL